MTTLPESLDLIEAINQLTEDIRTNKLFEDRAALLTELVGRVGVDQAAELLGITRASLYGMNRNKGLLSPRRKVDLMDYPIGLTKKRAVENCRLPHARGMTAKERCNKSKTFKGGVNERDANLLCDLKKGHDGRHHACGATWQANWT